MPSWARTMRTIDAKKWRRVWYIAGSALVIELLVLLASDPRHGGLLNDVSMDLRSWKLSSTVTEKPEREGRICVTRTICVGPITYCKESYDSVMARADRGATP